MDIVHYSISDNFGPSDSPVLFHLFIHLIRYRKCYIWHSINEDRPVFKSLLSISTDSCSLFDLKSANDIFAANALSVLCGKF